MNPEIFWHALGAGICFFAWTLVGLVLYLLIQILVESIRDWAKERRRRRIARIEAELDAKSEQLRRTILSLAQQLADERDEASRKMSREAFLASGKTSRGS